MRVLLLVALGCAPGSPSAPETIDRDDVSVEDSGADAVDSADSDQAAFTTLHLRSTPTPGGLSAAERDAGLAWSLSLLGASLPADPDA